MNFPYTADQESSTLPTLSSSSLNVQINQKNPQINCFPDRRTFFQTTKKAHRNSGSKKKPKYFSTCNDEPQEEIEDKVERKRRILPENYLDLLINALDKLMSSGEITLDYLNSKTFPKILLDAEYENISDEDETEKLTKKCENRMCAHNVENEADLFYARFNHSNSNKCENLKLCEKCYDAYKLENYCYYCNSIYRNFQFNEQYYDRKKWILCEYCEKWQHMQCEEKKGIYKNIEKLAMDKNFKYMCPFCRKENESYIKQQNKIDKGNYLFILFYL